MNIGTSDIALLFPFNWARGLVSDEVPDGFRHLDWFNALVFLGREPEVLGEINLRRKLSFGRYRTLVAAHCNVVDKATLDAVYSFVEAGGRLFVTDDSFKRRFDDWKPTGFAEFAAAHPDRVFTYSSEMHFDKLMPMLKPLVGEPALKLEFGASDEMPLVHRLHVLDRLDAAGYASRGMMPKGWTPEILRQHAAVFLVETRGIGLFSPMRDDDGRFAKMLADYVADGGRLFVLSWTGRTSCAGSEVFKHIMPRAFGVGIEGGIVTDAEHSSFGDPCEILTDSIVDSPVTEGVRSVQLFAFSEMKLPDEKHASGLAGYAVPVVKTPNGKVACATLEWGKGRVFLTTDAMLSQPFRIEHGVNNGDAEPEGTIAGVKKIVGMIREKHPESKILLQAILPHGKEPLNAVHLRSNIRLDFRDATLVFTDSVDDYLPAFCVLGFDELGE